MSHLTCDHHVVTEDFTDPSHHRKVEIRQNTLHCKAIGMGSTYCVITIGGVTSYINSKDYAEAIRHFSEVVSKLRAAHHKEIKATPKRCAVNIGLLLSGGSCYPSGEDIYNAVNTLFGDSLGFQKILKGHTVDDILIQVASLPK